MQTHERRSHAGLAHPEGPRAVLCDLAVGGERTCGNWKHRFCTGIYLHGGSRKQEAVCCLPGPMP